MLTWSERRVLPGVRPGQVRTPPEVRPSGGSGGGSGDGEPGTSPRVPNFPVLRRNPRRKFANFQRARRGRRGHLAPPRCRACCCHLSRRAARRGWWARAPGEGTRPSRGTWPSLRARKARERRGSVRSPSCSRLPPAAGSRWHHYPPSPPPPLPPNDSSRLGRGSAAAVPGTRGGALLRRQISPRNRLNFSRSS
ncbi:hypothetical protein VULLAG_LOCUS13090 [Vulpes lagopus]